MTILNFNELVNAFNIINYPSKTNTNFVVEGDDIVVKFDCDIGSAKKCLLQIKEDLVSRYFPDESMAGHFFDLGSFPFNFGKGKWMHSKAGTQFIVPVDNRVIFNFKVYFAKVCMLIITTQMAEELQEHGFNEKQAKQILKENMQSKVIDDSTPYLSCTFFNNTNLQRHFVQTLQAQMKEYCCNYLDFYYIDGNKIYFKDIKDADFVRSVIENTKKKIGHDLYSPSNSDLKVRSYKNAISELIFKLTGISICGYFRDSFIDKGRVSSGDRFTFVPVVKEGNSLRYLTYMEADKINTKFGYGLLTNVKGQTEATSEDEFIRSGIDRMYAFSDRQIALLIPVIIGNSVINKDGQLEIDPELRFRALSRSPSTEAQLPKVSQVFPTRHGKRLEESPRRGSEEKEETGGLFRVVPGGEIGQASASSQQTNHLSSPAPSAEPSLLQQSSNVITPSIDCGIPSRPILLTIKNDPKSSSPEFSARSPGVEDVKSICGVEPKERQVSDKSSEAKSQERKSPKKLWKDFRRSLFLNSKQRVAMKRNGPGRGTTKSTPETPVTEKSSVSKTFFSFPTRIKAKSNPPSGVASPTHEGAPGGLKPLTSDERKELRLFLSPELRKKLDSNSLEDEQFKYLLYTPGGKREAHLFITEGQKENLRQSVKAQLPGDRGSQASADISLGKSLERGQSPSLIEKFSDKLLINSRVDSPNIKKHLQKEEVFV